METTPQIKSINYDFTHLSFIINQLNLSQIRKLYNSTYINIKFPLSSKIQPDVVTLHNNILIEIYSDGLK